MKIYLAIISLLCAFLCCKCSKEEVILPDPYLVDLQDTLVFASPTYNSGIFMLDLDKDSIFDVEFEYFNHESHISPIEIYHKITPLNGFEISFSKWEVNRWSWDPSQIDTTFFVDTFNIAVTYNTGDTIKSNSDWTSEPIMLYYSISPSGPSVGLWNSYQYGNLQSTYYYIAFRKYLGNSPILAWIKLKNYEGITLNSCRYQDNADILIIK